MRWWKLELDNAMELADELLAIAEDAKDPAMLLSANWARGTILFLLSEFISANEHLEKALTVFDLRQPLPSQLELRRVSSFGYLYLGLNQLGYPDRAWVKTCEMMEVAQRSSDPYVLTAASGFAAVHNLMRGDGPAAQKHAEKTMTLIEAFGYRSLSELATMYHGAALIVQGRYEEGVAELRRGISAFRASAGTPYTWPFCFLASGLGRLGRPQEGLEVAEEGFASASKRGGQLHTPWLHQVKGELLLAQNPSSDGAKAEQCFRTAIEIARRRSAISEELAATTSLARLLAKHGLRDEARTMLAEIYGWFTEGFDTRDLKDAKALLDQLNE
jgi:predicted ATPase